MKRIVPYVVFLLVTAGIVGFVYQDKLFPPPAGGDARAQQPGGGGGSGGGRRFGGGGGRSGQPVSVLAQAAKTADVPVYLSGVGTAQAFNTATVRAQVSGRLIEVNYVEGQEVNAGDVLAKIDPVLYKAAYDQAVAKKAQDEALLGNARRDADRYSSLAKSDYSSQQQADTAKAQVLQYEAQVRQDQAVIDNAKANLDYTTIRAPISGRTGVRLIDTGNLVSSTDQTGIVIITQLRPISVLFTLPESTVSDVLDAQSKGQVDLDAIQNGTAIAKGTLAVIDNQIDQSTGTIKLKGTFPNQTNELWPGEFLNVRLKLKVLQNVVTVPSIALQQGAAGPYVFVVTPDQTAKLVNVKVTQEGERRAVIAEGVSAGDLVVTSGFSNLEDGTKVKVDTAEGAPQAGGERPQRRQRQSEAAAEPAQQDPAAQAQPVQGENAKGQAGGKEGGEERQHRRHRRENGEAAKQQ